MSDPGTNNFGSPGDDFPDEDLDTGPYYFSDDFQDFSFEYPDASFSDISITPELNVTITSIDSGQKSDSSKVHCSNALISLPFEAKMNISELSHTSTFNSITQPSALNNRLVDFYDSSLENIQSFGDPTRAPKRKVDLSQSELSFKDRFYAIFTTKKKFEKKLVKQIHDFIRKPFGFERMSREEFRRIDIYFQNYAKYSSQILGYLILHKEEIFDRFLSKSFNSI